MTDRKNFEALLDDLLGASFDQDWPAEKKARAAVLAAYDAARTDAPHGIMPANLAHKLQAFAAEPEGTINWKMIAWSLHRMLNAKAFTHPAPKSDRIERALAVQGEVEEGCTPADARLLRKANHDLAQESFEFRTALASLVQQIEAHAAQHGEGDFYTGDAVRLLSRTQEKSR